MPDDKAAQWREAFSEVVITRGISLTVFDYDPKLVGLPFKGEERFRSQYGETVDEVISAFMQAQTGVRMPQFDRTWLDDYLPKGTKVAPDTYL